jgi:hypothetical protein
MTIAKMDKKRLKDKLVVNGPNGPVMITVQQNAAAVFKLALENASVEMIMVVINDQY